jgi:hypothetical protein
VKKSEWKRIVQRSNIQAHELREAARLANVRARGLEMENRDLKKQAKDMREHWRPVPIAHPWQPRDPQCLYCDDPRDAPRHSTESHSA